MVWLSLRVDYAAPSLVLLSKFCIVLSMIQSLDRLVLCVGCFWIKLKKLVPVIEGKAYDIDDASSFAMVLVQIHMCNEKEVYEQSIGPICQLDWPKDQILIEVLDYSNDEIAGTVIGNEVLSWTEKGMNIIYRHGLSSKESLSLLLCAKSFSSIYYLTP